MFEVFLEKRRMKRETKLLRLERLHLQELCNHKYEYAGYKKHVDMNEYSIDYSYEHVAVCGYCGKLIKNNDKNNIETVINISQIKNSPNHIEISL